LEHDGFLLSECSSILKYLADLVESPAYPQERKARARVHQWMDWFLSLFSMDYHYGCIYPRVFHQYRLSEAAESERLAWHMPRVSRRLGILDEHLAQVDGGDPFICGQAVSIADYLGACFVTHGELIDFDLSPYPHIGLWIEALKARPAWHEVHAGFYGLRSAVRAQARGVT
ncbi:MAG TPA: glutathione S-transferase family protein, partial [Polyangiaceae bacterium]|nr:glutathione S-transferase family protein [Polyangiaceae bacterium]